MHAYRRCPNLNLNLNPVRRSKIRIKKKTKKKIKTANQDTACQSSWLTKLERFNFFCTRPDGSERNVVPGFSLLRRLVPAKAEDYFPPPSRLQYLLN